jgi:cytoskeletal protein RodZ
MESNITEQQYFDGDLQLGEPHFDEEATMLSARPVVPLQQIKADARSSRRFVFGLTIAVSLMIGALGATFIYKQRGQKTATAIVDTAVAGSGASAQNPEESGASTAETVAEPEARQADAPVENKKPAPQLARKVEPAAVETRPKKPISQSDEKEMRRADKIEARRLRRQERREARQESHGRNTPSDDLLRIREIFEGRRRP